MNHRSLFRAGERSFHELLYDWMERAPWLAISAAAHLLVYLFLSAIPWDRLRKEEPREILAHVLAPPEEFFEEPEPPPEALVVPPTDEPTPVDSALPVETEAPPGDPATEVLAWLPPTEFVPGPIGEIGLGPGLPAGGKYGPRGSPRGPGRGHGTEKSLRDALSWLAAHQEPDGSWDSDGFMARCGTIGTSTCGGSGQAAHDVGVTALALLAFLGDGHTTQQGEHSAEVRRAVAWLGAQQDPDLGLIGERSSHDFLYDHALATLALSEAYLFSRSPLLRPKVHKAVELILRARNPYSAWRYAFPPIGDSDTSVTGWMVFALASAKDAGIEVDYASAFQGALSFLDEVSDPASGRIGYTRAGELSSRTAANERFPRESSEALTAVGLLARLFLGQTPEDTPLLEKHAELIASKKPVWDPEGRTNDMYAWYYGTYALYQMGRPWWSDWEKAMRGAIVDSQRKDGDARGSWDPIGPWGGVGGRVYATALMALSLEVYYRYGRVLGAR